MLSCFPTLLYGGIILSDLDIRRYINQDKQMDDWLQKLLYIVWGIGGFDFSNLNTPQSARLNFLIRGNI